MFATKTILNTDLPFQSRSRSTRILIRSILLLFSRFLTRVEGIEKLQRIPDPFIVVLNHNHYMEALLIPALFSWYRGGHFIRFMADWNFMLIPFLGFVFQKGEIIPVTRKQARPRFLTGLRKYIVKGTHGFALAKQTLRQGRSVGIFPEGTINRNPTQLLPGLRGAAKLSIETGCPILPAGIRFPHHDPNHPISAFAEMEIHIGDLLLPPISIDPAPSGQVRMWHEHMMHSIGMLSNKDWHLRNSGEENDQKFFIRHSCHP